MKRMIVILATILLAGAIRAAEVKWEQDYDKALALAKTNNKLVVVDMYTDWCGWCKKLDRDVFANADVQAKIAKGFVPVKINPEKSEKGRQLARQFGTRGYPHIVFLDASGKKVSEVVGYQSAGRFSDILDDVARKSAK